VFAARKQTRKRIQAVRFRDDDPDLFGVEIGDGSCDEQYMHGLRDHLSHAVEIVPALFPDLARAITEVQTKLLPQDGVRAFVSGEPMPQAYCMGGRDKDTMIIGLTSGLIQLLTIEELEFVIGHEIGHYIMEHHRRVPPEGGSVDSINFRSLSRMAEISADRVGYLASPSGDAAFRAILKTAAGIGNPYLRFDYAAFGDQLRKLKEINGGSGDARASHPLWTVRCRAMSLFSTSEMFFHLSGKRGVQGTVTDEMEEKIASDLAESTGYHPVAEMERAVCRHLIWLMLRLFIEDGRFSKGEQAFLRAQFDPVLATNAIEYVKDYGPLAVCQKSDEALEQLALMSKKSRQSACAVLRRVASVAGGDHDQLMSLLREYHTKLESNDRVAIEPWDDQQSLGGLIEIA